jgi:Arc/MetJ-type ribon-helix-helix transcriptional regulator
VLVSVGNVMMRVTVTIPEAYSKRIEKEVVSGRFLTYADAVRVYMIRGMEK